MVAPAKPRIVSVADAELGGSIAYAWRASEDDLLYNSPVTHYGLVAELSSVMAADMANLGSFKVLVPAIGAEDYAFVLTGLENDVEYFCFVVALDMNAQYDDRQWRDYLSASALAVTPSNPFKIWTPAIRPEPTPLPLEYDVISPNGSISLHVKRDVVLPTLTVPCQLSARLRLTVTASQGIPLEVFTHQRFIQIIEQSGTIRDRFVAVSKPSDIDVYPTNEPLTEAEGPPFFRLNVVDLIIDSPALLLEADQSIYEDLITLVTETEMLRRIGAGS